MPPSAKLLEIIGIQSQIAKQGLDLGGVMSLLVERTLALVGADGAAIELAEDGDMVYRAAAGTARAHLGLRLKLDHSLSGLCVATGDAQRCDDSETDPRVDRDACRAVGLRSMIVIPLHFKEASIGVLKAMSARPSSFSEDDMILLGLLSDLVSAAMYFATRFDNSDLFYQATHDHLTGLANRALFMDRLRHDLARSARDGRGMSVLMIDMDGLKAINDHYGHRAGDAVLREFSNRCMSVARTSDTVARLGGDEFGVILSPIEPSFGVNAAAERIQSALLAPYAFEERTYQLRASIGSAQFPYDGDDIDTLIELADQRMYSMKRQRKGATILQPH